MAASELTAELAERINIPSTASSPAGLIEANTVDPFSQAGKYALGWTYLCIVLVVLISTGRLYHFWTDKLRQALYKEEVYQSTTRDSPRSGYSGMDMETGRTADPIFSHELEKASEPTYQHSTSSIGPLNDTLALFRWVFYRPIPAITWRKSTFSFPSLAVTSILVIAFAFVTLYCFLPQPYYWQSIQYGSPPLAIRAGMISVAMTPWIVATATKANLISMLTGISHERLNVLHRWTSYLCIFLALVHVIPFYVQPVWEGGGLTVFTNLISINGVVYGTGICVLVPLCWLCIGSLPIIRTYAHELFVVLHIPVAFVYVGLLFWHSQNSLSSWAYLIATCVIWLVTYIMRVFKLNWLQPWKLSWLVGDEAAITLMSEDAIKITVPTQMRWRPGQFVYLRVPGISVLENHPFTISSLCSDDFPSEYGEQYRDCIMVFRPFGGFTRKVLDTAIEKGPFKTYRAFLEGPYGGMTRELPAFDTVILFAGGSGITAIVSQLLNLIKRMRDGKAVTRKIVVVWALKRLEAMDWFREELRICREHAPPDTITFQFFVTAAVRKGQAEARTRAPRPLSTMFHDKLDGFVAGVAEKRHSALIQDEAHGDPIREMELRAEDEDAITSLPRQKYLQPAPPVRVALQQADHSRSEPEALRGSRGHSEGDQEVNHHTETRQYLSASATRGEFHFPRPVPREDGPYFRFGQASPRNSGNFADTRTTHARDEVEVPPKDTHNEPTYPKPAHPRPAALQVQIPNNAITQSQQNFGFPSTPTEFQKNLMRFAFLNPKHSSPTNPTGSSWSTEYGRPDLGFMLKQMATGGPDGKGILGRRTCVFVCGPPGMRVGVAEAVARLQADIWGDETKDEIFLWTENYAV